MVDYIYPHIEVIHLNQNFGVDFNNLKLHVYFKDMFFDYNLFWIKEQHFYEINGIFGFSFYYYVDVKGIYKV